MQKKERTSASERVVDLLLERIHSGELRPGDRLPVEREFAAQLGVSRVPLREAISALGTMGIIRRRQGDGNYVAAIPPEVLGRILHTYTVLDDTLEKDLFEARSQIEGTAARLAGRHATEEDIAGLRRQVADMATEVEAYIGGRRSLTDMLQADDRFHLQVAAAGHNAFYLQFVHILHTAGTDMGLYEAAYGQQPARYQESLAYHRALVDAIAAHDEALAEDTMCRHIESIRDITEKEASL